MKPLWLVRWGLAVLCCGARVVCARSAAVHALAEPVETVAVFFVQEVVAFQTEATETLAQDFSHYMSRNIRPRPYALLIQTTLWSRLPPGPVDADAIFPYTEPQGVLACVEHDMLPFIACAQNDRSPFHELVVIGRAGEIRQPADLRGKRLCIGGRRPGFDFYVLKHRLREVLQTDDLSSITLVHIYTNCSFMAEMRRDLLHYVLAGKADFTVARRYELQLFAQYYPHSAARLEIIPWLQMPPVALETWAAVPRTRLSKMEKYREELCRMHLDPEGEQYLMLVGYKRVMPIDVDQFFALTNYLHLVESLDEFVWP